MGSTSLRANLSPRVLFARSYPGAAAIGYAHTQRHRRAPAASPVGKRLYSGRQAGDARIRAGRIPEQRPSDRTGSALFSLAGARHRPDLHLGRCGLRLISSGEPPPRRGVGIR